MFGTTELRASPCAPQKVDPVLIARFRPDMIGCFWPVFFFADHRRNQLDVERAVVDTRRFMATRSSPTRAAWT